MTLVAGGEYLIRGEGGTSPSGPALPELVHGLFPVGAVLHSGRHEVGNRLAVAGDGNGLAVLDHPKEFGQPGLGFGGRNFTHIYSNQLV
jgi:hypothetical protein